MTMTSRMTKPWITRPWVMATVSEIDSQGHPWELDLIRRNNIYRAAQALIGGGDLCIVEIGPEYGRLAHVHSTDGRVAVVERGEWGWAAREPNAGEAIYG